MDKKDTNPFASGPATPIKKGAIKKVEPLKIIKETLKETKKSANRSLSSIKSVFDVQENIKHEKRENGFEEITHTRKVKVKTAPDIKKGYYGDVDIINLKGIDQVYYDKGNKKVIFDKFDFAVKDVVDKGQFIVILGTSGCGKSTILRYIAGLQKPTAGEIYLNGKLRTDKDRIGMVFQQYSSFTWKTVLQNVALPLRLKGVKKKEANERAMEMIKLIGLDGHENKWAKYPILSGGQLQRIAIARSLISNSEMLLMDEPFGALDIKTRNLMQDTLADLWTKMGEDPTIVLVTHSIDEAVYLGDEIYIMDANPGRVIHATHVNLPTQRNRQTKRDPRFIKTVHEIEDIMMDIEK